MADWKTPPTLLNYNWTRPSFIRDNFPFLLMTKVGIPLVGMKPFLLTDTASCEKKMNRYFVKVTS